MKTILLLAIILMASLSLYAQDTEPTTMSFLHTQSLDTHRAITRFYYGWNIE